MITFVIHFTIFAYKKKKIKPAQTWILQASDILCKAKVNIPKKKKMLYHLNFVQQTNINMVCFNSLSIDIKVNSLINNYVTLP